MRADRGRPGQPARPPDPDRHPGDGIRPQLATAGITPQDTRLTAPPAGRPPRAALQPRPWLERIEPYRPGLHADSDDGSLASACRNPQRPRQRPRHTISGTCGFGA